MNPWKPFPLLRILLPFIAGVVIERNFGHLHIPFAGLGVLLVVFLLITAGFALFSVSYGLRWIPGLPVNIFLLFAGIAMATVREAGTLGNFISSDNETSYIASVTEPPIDKGRYYKAFLQIHYKVGRGGPEQEQGRVMAYFSRDTGKVADYGDFIIFRSTIEELTENANPNTFNYTRFLKNKGICYRTNIDSGDWRKLSVPPTHWIKRQAMDLRNKLIEILEKNSISGRELAVASALLLGYCDDIDTETRLEYAASGAMHILSVSGMHVGVIYLFLEFVLGFLNRNRVTRVIRALIILLFIWFYAMLTGLSPCVLRAAIMLSLPVVARAISRNPELINVLAASCMILLVADPFLVHDVGFQLSYLAVAGIMLLYKPVYGLFVATSWLGEKIWSILSVSLAAQIITLPITLYTFHQFPNYFLITNIMIVPLSSVIIYCGVILLLISPLPLLPSLLGPVFGFLVGLMNRIIHVIESLPFSTTKGIFISDFQYFILCLILLATIGFILLRQKGWLFSGMLLLLVLCSEILVTKLSGCDKLKFTVFNTRSQMNLFFSGQANSLTLYQGSGGTGLSELSSVITTALQAEGLKSHRWYWFNNNVRAANVSGNYLPVWKSNNLIIFGGVRIYVLNRAIPKEFKEHLAADVVVISGSPRVTIAEVVKIFNPVTIVADATNFRSRTDQWEREAANLPLVFHNVKKSGAFEKDFSKDICK